jgi:hypothetical protein
MQDDQAVAQRTQFSAPQGQAQRGTGEQQPNYAPSTGFGMENDAAEMLQQLASSHHPESQVTYSRPNTLIVRRILLTSF